MIYQNFDLNRAPLISVFIFTYNQSRLVQKTIDSVLAQETDFPFEVVIAEDCSQDNTFDVCYSYFEQYPEKIRLIHNEKNKGLIRNFHESIYDNARGKYIAGVAGDDWWHDKSKLQKQVSFLVNNPDYGLVFSDTLVYLEEKNRLLPYKPLKSLYSFDQLIIQNSISALTTCYRKDLFIRYVDEVDPIKQDFPGEDYPMWIWFSYHTKIHKIDEPLTTYRCQTETLSHSNEKQRRLQFEADRINIKLFFYNYFNLNNEKILHDIYLQFYFLTLNTASEARDRKIEKDRAEFFNKHNYYLLLLLAKLNQWFANYNITSMGLQFILRVCIKINLINRYYKVYNESIA